MRIQVSTNHRQQPAAPKDGPFRKRNYTKVELAVLELISDGMGHSIEEIHSLVPDDLSTLQSARMFLSRLRKKLAPYGLIIASQKGLYYLARPVSKDELVNN